MSLQINQKKEAFLALGDPFRPSGFAVPVAGVSSISKSNYIHQAHHLNRPVMQQHPGRARRTRICVNLRHYRFLQSAPAPVFSACNLVRSPGQNAGVITPENYAPLENGPQSRLHNFRVGAAGTINLRPVFFSKFYPGNLPRPIYCIKAKLMVIVTSGECKEARAAVTFAGVSPINTNQANHLNLPAMSLHPGRARAARICVNLRHYLQCVPAPVFFNGRPTGSDHSRGVISGSFMTQNDPNNRAAQGVSACFSSPSAPRYFIFGVVPNVGFSRPICSRGALFSPATFPSGVFIATRIKAVIPFRKPTAGRASRLIRRNSVTVSPNQSVSACGSAGPLSSRQIRHNLSPLFVAPYGRKYTGTALALKSGNSRIRRVKMKIPAVPFFDFTTNTIYAAVIYSAQLIADAVSTPTSFRTINHNSQVTETASVFLSPDTNPAAAEGPDDKNPNLNKTNGDQRANCHVLFTEGRDAGDTSPHPVITAGTAVKGEYSESSEDRADLVSPRIRRSRFLQTHHPALRRGDNLGAVHSVGLDNLTGNAGFARAGDVAAPSFRPHQPNLNNPARCVVYAAGSKRTGDAPKSVRAYDDWHRPVLSYVPSAVSYTDTQNCPRSHRGLYGEGLFARQVFIRFKTFCWSSSVGRPVRKRPSRGGGFCLYHSE